MTIHPWNRPLWDALTRDRSRLPHALLLQGPAGVGKREFALSLAQWLLCQAAEAGQACGRCASCNWFAQGAHPDFRRIEPESEAEKGETKKAGKTISIKEIRELGNFLGLVSHQGGWRVVLIHPAELMNPAAGNALLKTLEEPPANVLMLLVSHQPSRLVPTVLSRCRKLTFPLPERDAALDWLATQGLTEASALLNETGGAPLTALEHADPERVERRRHFLDALAEPDPASLSRLAQESQSRLDEGWAWLARWTFDLLAVQAGVGPRYFPERVETLEKLARRVHPVALWHLQEELARAGRWLRHPLNAQLLLESWLIGYLDTMEAGHG